jgi:5'-nucleotidase
MRQILITGDDGPEATGIKVLRDHARQAYPQARIVQVTTEKQHSGASFSCSPGWERWKTTVPTRIDDNTYTLDLTPCDIITRLFLLPDPITDQPWDLVMSGVNHGSNVGTDIFLSATCSMAMMASSFYGAAAFAFSQDLPTEEGIFDGALNRRHFASADRVLPEFLRSTQGNAGECWNVNFPVLATQGYKSTKAAHYSRYRTPPTSLVPRAQEESSDVVHLAQGFVTITQLLLRVNPPMQYA